MRRTRLRSTWLRIKASYWLLPSLLTALALMLALGTIHLDRTGGAAWLGAYWWFDAAGPEAARAQLTVITTAMIAVASTVFAITIAAVAYASGNYGPRLLTNFMNDRGNQLSLAVFIAVFLYNFTVLRVVHNGGAGLPDHPGEAQAAAFVPHLSMTVSSISTLIAVGVLVYFLHHVPASIRINTVLGSIGKRLIRDIERRYPSEGSAEPRQQQCGDLVAAREVGYVEIIDFAELDEIARKNGLRLSLRVRTGDFVHPHLPLLTIVSGGVDGRLEQRLLRCFSLGESRTPTQDLEFLIDELAEIALRALSPGINDAFTAVTSLHWMAAAVAKLADRDLCGGPEQQTFDPARVEPLADDFAHFLRRSFGSVRASAAENVLAAKVYLQALRGIHTGARSAHRRNELAEEARRLIELAETSLTGPSLREVRESWASLDESHTRPKS
jgi:uncharacterized membrane protein